MEILNYARQYADNKKYADAYNNSKNQESYYRNHHDQLTICWGAEERLQNMGIDTHNLKFKDIEEHYSQLTTDRSRLVESYKAKESEFTRLKKMDDSVNKVLYEPSKPLHINDINKIL